MVILNDNPDSGRKIAWILIIGILPVIGLLLYIVLFGNFEYMLDNIQKLMRSPFSPYSN